MEKELNETSIEKVSITDVEPAQDKENVANENSEVAYLAVQVAEMNDKYLRAVAELENTRRRSALDAESVARNRAMSVAGNFLPVMDAVMAARAHTPDDAGIQSMALAMESAFAKIGITKIESLGQQLNPQFHNAVQVIEAHTPDEPCAVRSIPNTVIGELQTGYMFGDIVLRPAMVVVCK